MDSINNFVCHKESIEFYEKNKVTQDCCVSTQDSFRSLESCKFGLLLKETYLCQIIQRLKKNQFKN